MQAGIIMAAAVIGGVGLFVAIFLGVAGNVFAVEIDEKEEAVREALPGANCGGCGYSGCAALAAAIAKGEAPASACVAGGQDVADKIAAIMGTSSEQLDRKVAFVRCSGTCGNTNANFDYSGPSGCLEASNAPGGSGKSCRFGCMGFGDCVKACEFDAIHIVNGIAKVDEEKCRDCGKCIAACPKGLITEIPYGRRPHMACSNKQKGKPVMDACKVGCISCQKCVRSCPVGAITMKDNVPVIDYSLCVDCEACTAECPRGCLVRAD